MIVRSVLCLVTILLEIQCQNEVNDLKLGWTTIYPCEATNKITYYSEAADSSDAEYNFFVLIDEPLESDSIINITFAIPVALNKSSASTVFYFSRLDKLNVHLLSSEEKLLLRLKTSNGRIPKIESLLINNVESCRKQNYVTTDKIIPLSGLVNRFGLDDNPLLNPASLSIPEDLICGVRKVKHTGLITNGFDTKPGDWPWHVAIYRLYEDSIEYTCGGTLISKNVVMTAGHCATGGGLALTTKILRAVLGKYSLTGSEEPIQDKKISEIIVHPNFDFQQLENDIALLRLQTPAEFNDYVLPACLWKPELATRFASYSNILGTVVGWGYTQNNNISNELQQANLPRNSNLKCVKSNPLFFSSALNGNNFCAGWGNGTSACNGDSGGGFHVKVADSISSGSPKRWHVQGIISKAVAKKEINICDPTHYVVFTEVEKFIDWIYKYV